MFAVWVGRSYGVAASLVLSSFAPAQLLSKLRLSSNRHRSRKTRWQRAQTRHADPSGQDSCSPPGRIQTKWKQLRVGHRIHLEVAEPVLVNGVTVIPVGAPAIGEITAVRNKGMWGKSGHLAGRILYVTVNGRQVRLTGTFDDKGVAGGVGAALVSGLIFLSGWVFHDWHERNDPRGSSQQGVYRRGCPTCHAGSNPSAACRRNSVCYQASLG